MKVEKRMRKKLLRGGMSSKDGISLDGKYGVVTCTLTENGINTSYEEKKQRKSSTEYLLKFLDAVSTCAFGLAELWFIQEHLWVEIVAVALAWVVAVLTVCTNRNVKKNHAAEHLVIEYFLKNGEVPNKHELRGAGKWEQLSINCGSGLISVISLVLVIDMLLDITIPAIMTATVIFSLFKFVNIVGFPFQMCVLSNPDDENLEVAIEALRVLLEKSLTADEYT